MYLYHITNKESALSILKNGFNLNKKFLRTYGNGVYLSRKEDLFTWFYIISRDFFSTKDICCKIKCEIPKDLNILKLEINESEPNYKIRNNYYKKAIQWIKDNLVIIKKEIKDKNILKNTIKGFENEESYGYAIEKYAKTFGYDGIEVTRYYNLNNKKINIYSQIIIYDYKKIIPISFEEFKECF